MPEFKIETHGIGTHWWISIFDEISDKSKLEIEEIINSKITEFDNNYSRFKNDSFVGKLNKSKTLANFTNEFYEMMKFARKIHAESEGFFNIGIGKILENIGYDSSYSFVEKENPGTITLADPIIALNKERIEIEKDARIDLGGFGKGWLINKLEKILKNTGLKYFYINAGGDIYCTSDNNEPQEFLLESPFEQNQSIGKILIKNSAIASSGKYKRQWQDKKTGKVHNHLVPILDLNEVKEIAAVFTYGENSLITDYVSTLFFISPIKIAEKISKKRNVEYLIVLNDGKYFKSKGYPGMLNT